MWHASNLRELGGGDPGLALDGLHVVENLHPCCGESTFMFKKEEKTKDKKEVCAKSCLDQ